MISEDDIRKLANLARLELSPAEQVSMAKELGAIIDYIDQLNRLDVDSVEPTSHVHGITNVFRQDEVQPPLPIESLQEIVPDRNGRYIKVPIIVE